LNSSGGGKKQGGFQKISASVRLFIYTVRTDTRTRCRPTGENQGILLQA
jgi:transcriptional regulator of met regulon